jgi:hypothetical protein
VSAQQREYQNKKSHFKKTRIKIIIIMKIKKVCQHNKENTKIKSRIIKIQELRGYTTSTVTTVTQNKNETRISSKIQL